MPSDPHNSRNRTAPLNPRPQLCARLPRSEPLVPAAFGMLVPVSWQRFGYLSVPPPCRYPSASAGDPVLGVPGRNLGSFLHTSVLR